MTSKRGMTLVELLVVVAIMVMLVAVGLPMLRPMLEKQSQSQGAQVLRVMLLRARNMAVEKGIPCGLRLERYTNPDGTATEAAVRLSIVREQPAATAASSGPPPVGWRVAIDEFGKPTFYEWNVTWVAATTPGATLADFINDVGDGTLVQFWGSGEVFAVFVYDPNSIPNDGDEEVRFINRAAGTFTTDVTDSTSDLRVAWNLDDSTIPPQNTGPWYAYRAIRRGLKATENSIFPPHFDPTGLQSWPQITSSPASVVIVQFTPPWIPTLSPPMLMPEGVCVDLEYSGIGAMGQEFGGTGDVIVWFRPDGSLDRADVADAGQVRFSNKCDGLLHFLIGSWEQVTPNRGVLGEDASTNLELPANIWVTVEPRSARVLVNEIKVPTNADPNDDVSEARTFANEIWLEVAAPR